MTVTAVIPAMNEAANLPHVFARIPSCVTEIVLVDGNSSDDTIEVARALRPDVRVVLQNGRGKGNALACGFAAAHGDIIVMLDADGSTDPAEIPEFIAPLLAGADFAKGSRYGGGGGSADITRIRDTGNRALGGAVNLLFGTKFTDLCYGYNAFWRSCLPHMHITCDGFEVETLINIRVARAGLRVTEVASYEQERIHGESNLRAIRDGRRVLGTILRERLSRRVKPSDSWRPEYRELCVDHGSARAGVLSDMATIEYHERLQALAHLGVSVVICAYSECRWDALVEAVASVREQNPVPHEVVVVIDHNDALLARAAAALPDALVVANAESRGLSGARNTGVRHASGAIVAFLDDDASARPGWLLALIRAFEDASVIGVGGVALPVWESSAPAWLPSEFLWVVGCSYRGLPAQRAEIRNPIGANMAFRRAVLKRVGGFTDGIGRIGRTPLGCEETELSIRARQATGGRIVQRRDAEVEHLVSDDRVSWSYFRRRCWAEGLSKVAVARRVGSNAALASERSYVVRTLPVGVWRGLADAARGDRSGLARAGAIVCGVAITAAGYVRGRLSRGARPTA